MLKMRPCFTAVFMLLLSSFVCLAQRFTPDNYIIEYIGMDNGLMHNFVDDIYRDERGFVWFATRSGLSRFDGYDFVHYTMNSFPVGLKGNSVHKLCEDDFGRLWIASNGGLDVLSFSEQKLVDLFTNRDFDSSFLNQPILNLEKDAKGDFWLFSVNTLYKIVLNADGEIESVFKLTIDNRPVRYVAMTDIDGDGNIWIGVNDKILKTFVDNGKRAIRTQPVSRKLTFRRHTQVNKILLKENEVWIATDRGLYRYFKNEDAVKVYVHDEVDDRSISQDFVTDLCVTSSKMLIASTLNGINIYQPSTDRFERIGQDKTATKITLNSNFVNCLYSSGDILWIGTETGGVNKITPRNAYVKIYTHQENMPGSISKNPVNAILEDRDGNLWVGTVEGGLNLKRKGTNFFEHFTTVSSTRLGHNSVSALSIDDKDRLWVGTWGNGVTILDRKHPSKPASNYLNAASEPGFLIDFVGALQYDKINRGMWLGTNQGLYFYDLNTETLTVPFHDRSSTAISNIIGSAIDENNRLWVGCDEGVYVVNLNRGGKEFFSYTHYKYKLDDPQSRLIDKITCIHLDSKGVLWLGSDGFGLYRRMADERGNYSFKAYTMADGLASNNVKGILEDDSGNLWISTNNGLSFLDRESLQFSNLYKEDGLGSSQFYWNAYCKTRDGTLYFGTVDGLVGIDAESIFSNVRKYKVTLTNLAVNNRPVFPGKFIDADISISDRMVIHEKEKSFKIGFSALNYFSIYNYVYSYRLLGYDENWIEASKNEHSAAYMNLPPGKYIFQVKYTPKNRKDFGEITQFEIRIKPYFYKTFWFKSVIAAFVLFLILSWYFWRIRSYEVQHKRLEKIVEERTQQLETQNETLTKQKFELLQQNDALNRQKDEILRQKQQIVDMSRKVQKMNQERLDFFTNLSHEFRTPITLIAGPVERALRLSTNPYVIEQLHFAERNSKYLLTLIDQLMDFQKIESKRTEIDYRRGNFVVFLKSLCEQFAFQLKERDLELRMVCDLPEPEFFFDEDAFRKILTNLLSNAIKYTPNSRSITLYAKSFNDGSNAQSEKLYLAVKDEGIGIPEEDLDEIFKRFHQSRNQAHYMVQGQSGTGIGLYLCKQIVVMLGGKIWAKNNKNGGSVFRIMLPLHRANPHSSEFVSYKPISANRNDAVNDEKNYKEWRRDKLNFLIVEDNVDMGSYISSMLNPYYNTIEAANGEEALTILRKHNIDFIISDLMMPVMDGLTLSKRVKESIELSHIPFLMLTAKSTEKARTESYRLGVDSYLVKPFSEEVLLARIQNILKARERYQKQLITRMDTSALELSEESKDKKFMENVLEIMKQNFQNSAFDVSDFAEAMNVSKSLLNKKLNALSGKSAGQFIRVYRLNLAYNLILHNKGTKNKTISDIAYEVGFNDPKYFTRCFVRQFNITPSELLNK